MLGSESSTASNCSRRMCELSLPHFPKARCDHPSRRDEFRARDLPPQLRGLYTDAGVGLVRCVSSSEVFRSNDYSKLGAHWYHGQKKAYATKHQCRRTGELVQKRMGSPKVYRGDRTLDDFKSVDVGFGVTKDEVIIQRPCRTKMLPLDAVCDPLKYKAQVKERERNSEEERRLRYQEAEEAKRRAARRSAEEREEEARQLRERLQKERYDRANRS